MCHIVGARPERICENGKPLYRVRGTCPKCKREFKRIRKPRRRFVCTICTKEHGLANTPYIVWELMAGGSVKGLEGL
jgi:predicted amidophosphoribosyltransferase